MLASVVYATLVRVGYAEWDNALRAGSCRPSDDTLAKAAGATAVAASLPAVPFYLDEAADLGMAGLHDCLFWKFRLRNNNSLDIDFDTSMPPNLAEHLSDVLVLRALRRHPNRVFNPARAVVHVVGIMPVLSGAVTRHFPQCANPTGGPAYKAHRARMQIATDALQRRLAALPASTRRVYVIVSSYNHLQVPLAALISAHPDRFVVAAAERIFCWSKRHPVPDETCLVIPYVASRQLDLAARAPCAAGGADRNVSFAFAGNFDRMKRGKYRGDALMAIAAHAPGAEIRHHNFKFDATADQRTGLVERTTELLLRTRHCAAPEGDTCTSRRIFDALAAG